MTQTALTTPKNKTGRPQKLTTSSFITASKEIFGDRYSYEHTEFINSTSYITITCKEHGAFKVIYPNHLKGHGCPTCGQLKAAKNHRKTTETFIAQAIALNGDRYDYSKTSYMRSDIKVVITCKVHGDFHQLPGNHLNGYQCKACAVASSKAEDEICKILTAHALEFKQQVSFEDCRNPSTGSKLYFDFYLPALNTLVEYAGPHHFKPVKYSNSKEGYVTDLVKSQHRDRIKNDYASSKGMQLLRIPYTHSGSLEQVLHAACVIPAAPT